VARRKRFAAGKTLAQAESTSAEPIKIPKGGAASGRRDPKQKDIRKDVLLFW